MLVILAAVASLAATLLVGSFGTVMAFILVPPLIFSFLLLCKQLNLSAVLEVMALGAVDLAVLLVGASWLAGGCQGQAGGTPGNLLAGVISLGFFGGAGLARSLNGKHPTTVVQSG